VGSYDRLPLPLSERLASATKTIFNKQGREYDVAIAGIPFRLATSSEVPQSVETVSSRRDQLDTETDPGEQSLTSWWRRAQSSWHQGAGNLYQENSDQTIDSTSFYASEGVDVFTPGQLTLLRRMKTWTSPPVTCSRIRSYANSGVSLISAGQFHPASSINGTLASLHAPAGKTLVDGLISGTDFYDVASDGTLYQGQVSSPGSATSWPCGPTPSRLGWGMHRLWVIGGRKIWQPNLSLAGGSAQNPIFTNPNTGWTYTCMAEGGSAMLFGGNDGYSSSIQAITLNSDGSLPTLSGATVAAVLPDGELVQEIAVLAGQYVGIGTTQGFRIGTLDTNGRMTYGPLIFTLDGVNCTSITTQGRFFVVGFSNNHVYRVDTGTPLDNDIFPYARDVQCSTLGVTSLSAARTQLIATTSDGGVWYQSATEYVDSGYLQTSRIRFRTTELKNFKFLTFEIDPLVGIITCQVIKDGGSTIDLGRFTTQGELFTDRFEIADEPMRFMSVKFILSSSDDKTGTPTLHSYLVRALPAVAPQRMITLPLLCYDRERASSGQFYGGKDFASDRLMALQLMEDTADTVLYQDFTGADSSGRAVTIESLKFVQTVPAVTPSAVTGAGGILIAQLRTVI